jgi:acetyl esterase/lipase
LKEAVTVQRRELLKAVAGGAMVGSMSSKVAAAIHEQKHAMKTYVYKKVAGCEIKADVHGAGTPGDRKPVVVTIHGGALIVGSRSGIRRELFDPLLDRGFVIVSIDYRLAPETKLPAIIEDVRDAFDWVRREGPQRFGADPKRIGVQGGSAGGYLTLMTGFCVEPRPRALVAYYGYGDIIGDWYSKPDPYYRKQPLVSEDAARAVIADHAISEPPPDSRRHIFYLYCRQNGMWPKEVAGLDPRTQAEAFKPYCPVQNVTPDYPPTLLCHGNRDNDVPYEQSVQMATRLAQVGVPYEFLPLQHADHGFGGADRNALRSAIERSIAFLIHYVEGTQADK